jgi:hypothetical protein
VVDEWVWTSGRMIQQEKTKVPGNKPVPVLHYSPQIPHGLAEERDRTTAVTGRRGTCGICGEWIVSGNGIPPNVWVILFLIIIYPAFLIDWPSQGWIMASSQNKSCRRCPLTPDQGLQIVFPKLWLPSVRYMMSVDWFVCLFWFIFDRYGKCVGRVA